MDRLVESYRLMWIIRRFEETIEELFTTGVIKGTTHPCSGQEAVAVGACNVLADNDYITSNHRGHGHFLARGADPKRVMAELYGKASGYSRGRGGSQFMADFNLGFVGGNGITGGSIPVATGVALACRQRNLGRIAVCFFGDGATNQGTFHESLNMAGLWQLPVVYVCENNQYAMSMHVSRSVPIDSIADRAAGYGMPGVAVDGNDLVAVEDAVRSAVERARSGGGPTLVECKTYRLSGHSRGDPRVYRSAEEEADWRNRDPIQRLRDVLTNGGAIDEEQDRAIREEVERTIAAAVAFAEADAYPEADTLCEGVFA